MWPNTWMYVDVEAIIAIILLRIIIIDVLLTFLHASCASVFSSFSNFGWTPFNKYLFIIIYCYNIDSRSLPGTGRKLGKVKLFRNVIFKDGELELKIHG